VFDDVLVNFDPHRTCAAAATILEVARERQVLLLTCHPWLVETIRSLDPGVPVLT